MATTEQRTQAAGARPAEEVERFDAIIIGAGVTVLFSLYCILKHRFSFRAFEEVAGVGFHCYWYS